MYSLPSSAPQKKKLGGPNFMTPNKPPHGTKPPWLRFGWRLGFLGFLGRLIPARAQPLGDEVILPCCHDILVGGTQRVEIPRPGGLRVEDPDPPNWRRPNQIPKKSRGICRGVWNTNHPEIISFRGGSVCVFFVWLARYICLRVLPTIYKQTA